MLGTARWRVLLAACIALVAAALLATFLSVRGRQIEVAFGGCWASVILLAAGVHLRRVPPWLAAAAAIDAGLWAGALIAGEGARSDLLSALPAVLVSVPAQVATRRGWQIAIKVVSSWLIAIALLAALLPTAPTPGYMPDHMD